MDAVHRIRNCVIAGALLIAVAGMPVGARGGQQGPASADWMVEQSSLCTSAIHDAERNTRIPAGLLEAIAKAESGRTMTATDDVRSWPWTIDADGQDLFLDSKAAAIAWVSQERSRHKYIDVGCLQVDLAYHPEAFASLEEAFDPVANANYAARHLLGLYRGPAGRDWNVAVGLYHSHTAIMAAAYRDRVAMIGAEILRGVLAPVPLYVRTIREGTLRLPLASGKSTPINVNRQPAARPHRRLSSCEIERILGSYLNSPSNRGCSQTARASRL